MMFNTLLLDLDGTIIVDQGADARSMRAVELLPGVAEGLRALAKRGCRFFIVTNQGGIARGMYTEDDFRACLDRTTELLREAGVEITATRHCPHDPKSNCGCRKPAIGMWESFVQEFPDLTPKTTLMVGDKDGDMLFGKAIGCETARIHPSHYPMSVAADYTVEDIAELLDVLPS